MEWIELMEWNEERNNAEDEYAFEARRAASPTGQFDFFFFFDSA
jgi:hypothetical protein